MGFVNDIEIGDNLNVYLNCEVRPRVKSYMLWAEYAVNYLAHTERANAMEDFYRQCKEYVKE